MTTDKTSPPRFFYGWTIVAVLAITSGITLSMGGANFGLFVSPMREELGFDQAFFGWANTARLVGGALGGIIIGRLIDLYGPRFLLAVLIGLGTFLVAMMGWIQAEWQMLLIFALLGALGMQGAANIYTSPVVSKWFVRKRAKALAFMYVGTPLVLVFSYPVTQALIETFGWRGAWIAMGGAGFFIIVPLSLIFLRRQPEDVGLQPDGDPAANAASVAGEPEHTLERSWTRSEALRSLAFWRITIVFGLHMLGQGSVALFRFPHYEERGVDPSLMSYAASLEGVSSIAAAATVGLLLLRFNAQLLVALGILLMALSHTFTIMATDAWHVAAAMTAFGLGVTYVVMGQNIIFPTFFGRRHIGAIRGVSWGVTLSLAAVSAPLTGYVADVTGNFVVIWWPIVGLLIVTAIIMAFTRAPATPSPAH